MTIRNLTILAVPLLLACGRPAVEALRRQPAPHLRLEVSLPDGPDQAEARQAYLTAFRRQFGKGLATGSEAASPDCIQLIVAVGSRKVRPQSEEDLNRELDQASAIAARSPMGLLNSRVGPRSPYESSVGALGYRPPYITGHLAVMRTGKGEFQELLRLEPLPIIYHMRPLGEEARAHGGIVIEEANAVALESLDLLKEKLGWAPPAR